MAIEIIHQTAMRPAVQGGRNAGLGDGNCLLLHDLKIHNGQSYGKAGSESKSTELNGFWYAT